MREKIKISLRFCVHFKFEKILNFCAQINYSKRHFVLHITAKNINLAQIAGLLSLLALFFFLN